MVGCSMEGIVSVKGRVEAKRVQRVCGRDVAVAEQRLPNETEDLQSQRRVYMEKARAEV